MSRIQDPPSADPATGPPVGIYTGLIGHVALTPTQARDVYVLLSRAELMGFYGLGEEVVVRHAVDPEDLGAAVDDVASWLAGAGVATALPHRAGPLHEGAAGLVLDTLLDATEHNALPEGEWAPLRRRLGDDLLADLVDISEASLRRYASGQRATPDPVADRLHWLALVVADVDGSYNALGIRRWFRRPRTVLDGRSPLEALTGGFDPDEDAAGRVRQLARALVDLGAS